ncbi:hypothetical protein [Saccharopolyspora tripterygii]
MDVAVLAVVFAGIPPVERGAFDAGGFLTEPVAAEQLPVEDDVGDAVGFGLSQCVAGPGLGRPALDNFVDVAVAGDAGDVVVAGQCGDGGAITESTQPQHGLLERRQRAASAPGATTRSLGIQESREVEGEFVGDVEAGR